MYYSVDIKVAPDDSGGVTITPPNCGLDRYEEGMKIELDAQALEGFEFIGWSGDVESATVPLSVAVSSDMQIVAEFERVGGGACVGDCNGNGTVAINELIVGVNIALGRQRVSACRAFDSNQSQSVTINELVRAVGNALSGC